MDLTEVNKIVEAVLYEGYILYPYRPSAVKNQQRWSFGGVYPRAYSQAQGDTEPWSLQTQCLLQGTPQTVLHVLVRFLHLINREVGALAQPLPELSAGVEPPMRRVDLLEIGDRRYYRWQEAREQPLDVAKLGLDELLDAPRRLPFAVAGGREVEPVRDATGAVTALLVRTWQALAGHVELTAEPVVDAVFRITVRVANLTQVGGAPVREQALRHALVSTHTILGLEQGAFISLLDPPASLREAAARCDNIGTWPVLVGEPGETDTLLSSPIILYDYPRIASESPGSLFDGTEIDELLTLRILTLTEQEQREMAAVDEHARALLERTQSLSQAQLQRLHGTLRSLRSEPAGLADPWRGWDDKVRLTRWQVGGVELKAGDRVRLRPGASADILDLALAGKEAIVEAIECDLEGQVHIAVVVDEDPGKDLGMQRLPGHRFFFASEEVEPLASNGARR